MDRWLTRTSTTAEAERSSVMTGGNVNRGEFGSGATIGSVSPLPGLTLRNEEK